MVVEFRVERRSGVPTYLQLVAQVRQALRTGALETGDRLPTAKAVVEATAINPNTVLKAYRELEREGLVEARPGAGTFVLRTLARPDSPVDRALRERLREWMAEAAAAGLGVEDVKALVAEAIDRTYEGGRTDG
ncbi:GntR family transcriptional regulator [Pseudonocardia sp. WMMC193]|uniref:GntR family transcriptional regulator n=1 Tax=Pseudonocardia sp. WMMC193 TaxID=2911965 RepID=UPI001F00A652|nr:GntR family transcriptional regulator [Pseudonocardia sp. WMMC193]MCF7548579.1 GntR family transcriptional regulator [Pseudonocardia sp. WMMC193]